MIFRGPNINHKVAARLIELAESNSIPYQLAAVGRATPNDANVLQTHGAGVATGLVAIPNRYMHSAVEVTSLDDLDHVAELLSLFAKAYPPKTASFRARRSTKTGVRHRFPTTGSTWFHFTSLRRTSVVREPAFGDFDANTKIETHDRNTTIAGPDPLIH